MERAEIEKRVEEILNDIRPYLQSDGGDVSFIELSDDEEVTIQLVGACGTCPMRMHTFKTGIEYSIKTKIPTVKKVIAIDEQRNIMFPNME